MNNVIARVNAKDVVVYANLGSLQSYFDAGVLYEMSAGFNSPFFGAGVAREVKISAITTEVTVIPPIRLSDSCLGFPFWREYDSRWQTRGVCHGSRDFASK